MRWITLGVSILAFGCTESVESEDIRTSGVYPEITVTATGNGNSTVSVRLDIGARALCLEFGGTQTFVPGKTWKALNANAPAACLP